MVSIEEARAQVATARQLVAEKKAQAEQVQSQLNEQEQSLPSTTSQQALRQRFKGIQGRIQRQRIDEQRSAVQEQQGYVSAYQDELGRYEQDINTTEAQINDYERKAEEAQRDAREEARAELDAYKAEFEAANPGEKLIIDWTKLRIKGVNSDVLSMSMPVDEYNAKIAELNTKLDNTLSSSNIDRLNTRLSRNDKVSYTQNKDVKGGLFTSVSAMAVNEPEINPNTGRPYGVISAAPEPKGVIGKLKEYARIQPDTQIGIAKGTLAGGGASLASTASALVHPRTTAKSLWGGLSTAATRVYSNKNFPEAGALLSNTDKLTPYHAGYLAGSILTSKGLSKVAQASSSIGERIITRLDPRYVKYNPITGLALDNIEIKEARALKNIKIPLSTQARVAGQRVNAVSAQRDLFELFTNERIIRKPLPNEGILSQTTKDMLKRFDEGRLTPRQIESLNKRIIRESGDKGLLERSFFADPYGRVRVSRLGVLDEPKEASLFDVYTGEATFKKGKPQIVYFKNVPVENLPYNLKEKLLSGMPLSEYEAAQLRNIQLQKSGKFKPVGFLSSEPEITLAPGEVIKKKRIAGVTLVNGRRVSIIEAEIAKQSKSSNAWNMFFGSSKKTKGLPVSYDMVSKPYVSSAKVGGSMYSLLFGSKEPSEKVSSSPSQKVSAPISKVSTSMTSGFSQVMGISYKPSPKSPSPRYKSPYSPPPSKSFDWFGFSGKYPSPRTPKSHYPPKNPTIYITYPPYKPSVSYRTSGGKVIKAAPGQYIVMVRRYGIDSIVGEASTLEEAKRILSYNLRSTLGASGFISSGGKKQDVSNLWGGMFTSAKKDRFRLVQKRGKRLSSRSEVGEIMGFARPRPIKKLTYKDKNDLWKGFKKPKKAKELSWWG